MALTSEGKLYGWGWNKVIIFVPLLPFVPHNCCLIQTAQARFYYILLSMNTNRQTFINGSLVPIGKAFFFFFFCVCTCIAAYIHMVIVAMMSFGTELAQHVRFTTVVTGCAQLYFGTELCLSSSSVVFFIFTCPCRFFPTLICVSYFEPAVWTSWSWQQ